MLAQKEVIAPSLPRKGSRSILYQISPICNVTAWFSRSTSPELEKSEPLTRNDIAVLYTLIGMLYSTFPPEHVLQF